MNSEYQTQTAEPIDGAVQADFDGGGWVADIPAAFTDGMPPDGGAQERTDGSQASASIN